MTRLILLGAAALAVEVGLALVWPWLLWYYAAAVVIGVAGAVRLWWWMHTWR
jgi:hypothetical protein